MTSSTSTEFTSADGRRFALPVGGAFLVLAAVLLWRERTAAMWTMATLGGVFIVAGALVPGRLEPVHRAWMAMAVAISRVTTPIFMGVVYFIIFTPVAWIMRVCGKRPIVHQPERGSFWRSSRSGGDLRRQF